MYLIIIFFLILFLQVQSRILLYSSLALLPGLLVKTRMSRLKDPGILLLLLPLVYALFNVILSGNTEFLTYKLFYRMDGKFFVVWSIFLSLALSTYGVQAARSLQKSLPFVLVALAVYGVIFYYGFAMDKSYADLAFFKGQFYTHNAAAGFYGSVAIVLLGVLAQQKRFKFCVGPLIVLLFVLSFFFLAKSRAFTLGLLAASAVFSLGYFKWNKKMLRYGLVFCAGIMIALYFFGVFDRFIYPSHVDTKNITSRLKFWSLAIELFKESPLFGIGLGRYDDYVYIYMKYGSVFETRHLPLYFSENNVHNFVLHVLVEQGVVGLVLFFTPLFFWLNRFVKMESGKWSSDLLVTVSLFVYIFVASFFGNSFWAPSNAIVFYVYFSYMINQYFLNTLSKDLELKKN